MLRFRTLAVLLASLPLGAALAADIPIYRGASGGAGGYVIDGRVAGGAYSTRLYSGTPPRYIDRYYQRSGVRPYFERRHERYLAGPTVIVESPEIPILVPRRDPPRYRKLAPNAPAASRHERWCRNAYRTFRQADGTYQPRHGPRQECVSPSAEPSLTAG